MDPISSIEAVALPLVRDNVDTDAIIPSREMKSVSKKGLADGLFAGWRYTEIGGREPNPDFVLNNNKFANAQILISGDNFGCGSSREHAAWALAEYGFRAIIAISFNPIFRRNCMRNGIVPIALSQSCVTEIAAYVSKDPKARLITADLENKTVHFGDREIEFEIEPEAREMLLNGLDMVDQTLTQKAEINAFIERDRELRSWIYLRATKQDKAGTMTE